MNVSLPNNDQINDELILKTIVFNPLIHKSFNHSSDIYSTSIAPASRALPNGSFPVKSLRNGPSSSHL